MSFARTIRRGAFWNARFGVNGTQKACRSLGTDATGRVASDIVVLLESAKPIPSPPGTRNASLGGGDGRRLPARCTDELPHPTGGPPGAIVQPEQMHPEPAALLT